MKIISADYVLTMNSNLDCIKDGAILIDGALIKQVGTLQELTQQYPEAAVDQYPKSLLMPGLINTHCHQVYCAVQPRVYRSGTGCSSLLIRCIG